MIKFDCTKEERRLIHEIVKRAALVADMAGTPFNRISARMDLEACHCNGTPLDLERLRAADDFNICHDVFGIGNHIDRDDESPTGGQLLGHFRPRFARRDA